LLRRHVGIPLPEEIELAMPPLHPALIEAAEAVGIEVIAAEPPAHPALVPGIQTRADTITKRLAGAPWF